MLPFFAHVDALQIGTAFGHHTYGITRRMGVDTDKSMVWHRGLVLRNCGMLASMRWALKFWHRYVSLRLTSKYLTDFHPLTHRATMLPASSGRQRVVPIS